MLDRVELQFRWDHPNSPTPSLTQIVEATTKAEPGSKKNLVFVKNVNTRFGMARTPTPSQRLPQSHPSPLPRLLKGSRIPMRKGVMSDGGRPESQR